MTKTFSVQTLMALMTSVALFLVCLKRRDTGIIPMTLVLPILIMLIGMILSNYRSWNRARTELMSVIALLLFRILLKVSSSL